MIATSASSYIRDGLLGQPVEILLPERILRDSEECYRLLFENASDLIQSVKSDG